MADPLPNRRIRIAVPVLAIVGVGVVGIALASRGLLSERPAAAQIAIVDDAGALFTFDDRGGSKTAYPVPDVVFGFPAWSLDGQRIAVVGDSEAESALYVFDTTGGSEPTVVYHSADRRPFYLYWTPDGEHVSFLTAESVGLALRVAPVTADAEATVIRRGAPLYVDWVGDDRALLHVGEGEASFVGQVDLDGTELGSAIAGTGHFRAASLSGDGQYVAYATSGGGPAGSIVVEPAAGSGSGAADTQRVAVFGPAAMLFDPTGVRLAAIAANTASAPAVAFPLGPLILIDPASGEVTTLLDTAVVAFFWAPDGRTIAALAVPGGGSGPVADAADAAPPRELEPRAEADGTGVRLVFVDAGDGSVRSERTVRLADHFVSQLLPYFDQYALSHRLWSPDSGALLLPLVSSTGQDQLVVIPADGSSERVIADGNKGFWRP